MRLATFNVAVEFDADISSRQLVKIRKVKAGHGCLTPEWAQANLSKIILGKSVKVTTGHFRLWLKLSDPHLEQQALPQ